MMEENQTVVEDRVEQLLRLYHRKTQFVGEGSVVATSLSTVWKDPVSNQMDFYDVGIQLLMSMIEDDETKQLLKKVLQTKTTPLKRQHNFRFVTWPNVFKGVFKQFEIDIPRCHFTYKGTLWRNPKRLFDVLQWDFGPIWSRWICVFANQAPLADVVKRVHVDTNKDGGDYIVMEVNPSLMPHLENIDLLRTAFYTLEVNDFLVKLSIRKTLMIVRSDMVSDKQLVDTLYEVTFRPHLNIELEIKIKK